MTPLMSDRSLKATNPMSLRQGQTIKFSMKFIVILLVNILPHIEVYKLTKTIPCWIKTKISWDKKYNPRVNFVDVYLPFQFKVCQKAWRNDIWLVYMNSTFLTRYPAIFRSHASAYCAFLWSKEINSFDSQFKVLEALT